MDIQNLSEISVPISDQRMTSADILLGKRFDPAAQLKIYSDKEYEIFISEWVSTIEKKYAGTFKTKDGGDKGCDVIGFYDSVPSDKWDNYQCKHYDHPISPGELSGEAIKLIYYTFVKEYTIPQKYYFVAPQGVSNDSLGLLRKPKDLKNRIIQDWDKKCPDSSLKIIDPKISAYVDGFDLTIFSFIDPQDLINQHSETKWHRLRFGGGLKPRSKTPIIVPREIDSAEDTYIGEILGVYEEAHARKITVDDIQLDQKMNEHFNRQRRFFYCAESLRIHARENLPEDGDFVDLQNQIHDGIVGTLERNHPNLLTRLDATVDRAQDVNLSDHVLISEIKVSDRSGICHQLVNEKRFKWNQK